MFGGVQAGSAFVELNPDLDGFQQQLSSQFAPITGKFGKLGAAGGTALVAGVVAAAAVGKLLYDIGAEFDDAYDQIRVGTGATGRELEALKTSFKSVVSEVPADFGDAATAISQLNQRLGISGKPLERLSAQFLELSRITGTDLEDNIAQATRTFGDWGVKVSQQPAALDKMFRASQATGISISELGAQMVRYGAPLRQMGFGFEQAAAMVGKFEAEGVNAQLVMGSLRIALGRMATEGVADPAKALGILTDRIKNAGSAGEANALALETFGARAGPDMAAAIREGRFEFGDLVKSISDGKETIRGAGKDTMDLGEHWKLFTNRLKVLVEPIATKVFEAVGKGMEHVNKAMADLAKVDWGKVKSDIQPLITAFEFLGKVALHYLKALVEGVKVAFNVIRGVVLAVSGLLKGDFGQMWNGIKLIFKDSIGRVLDLMRSKFASVKDVAVKIGQGVVKGFDAVKKIVATIKNAVSGVINAIRGGISAAASAARSLADKILDPIRSVIDKAKSIAGNIVSAIANALKGAAGFARAAANVVIDLLNDAIPNSINVPGPAPNINLPDNPIPRLARGTSYFEGGPAIVGERGPELLNLPRGTEVTGTAQTARLLGEMAGRRDRAGNLVFNIETIGTGNPDTGHLVALLNARMRALGAA